MLCEKKNKASCLGCLCYTCQSEECPYRLARYEDFCYSNEFNRVLKPSKYCLDYYKNRLSITHSELPTA